jgi:methionyl-tRNA formyltransferase
MAVEPLKIVFMGTPEFAVATLEALLKAGKQVVVVITAPDKPTGRGQLIQGSPVKECALHHQIPLLQPLNLKDQGFLNDLAAFKADLGIVVAFRMLPEAVWKMPRLGTFNLHASLLPKYRGAAPINWALMNGENETGLTTFFLKHEIDTGDLFFQEKEPIFPEDNLGSLYERLMKKGADLVVRTVDAIEQGHWQISPQQMQANLPLAPKLFKEHCLIDWGKSSVQIHNQIRGLSPIPAAYCLREGKVFKLFQSSLLSLNQKAPAGTWLEFEKGRLAASTGDGWLELLSLKPEGKRKMTAAEWLRGNPKLN